MHAWRGVVGTCGDVSVTAAGKSTFLKIIESYFEEFTVVQEPLSRWTNVQAGDDEVMALTGPRVEMHIRNCRFTRILVLDFMSIPARAQSHPLSRAFHYRSRTASRTVAICNRHISNVRK